MKTVEIARGIAVTGGQTWRCGVRRRYESRALPVELPWRLPSSLWSLVYRLSFPTLETTDSRLETNGWGRGTEGTPRVLKCPVSWTRLLRLSDTPTLRPAGGPRKRGQPPCRETRLGGDLRNEILDRRFETGRPGRSPRLSI